MMPEERDRARMLCKDIQEFEADNGYSSEASQLFVLALAQIDADERLMRKALEAIGVGRSYHAEAWDDARRLCADHGWHRTDAEQMDAATTALRARLGEEEGSATVAAESQYLSIDADLLEREPGLLREITFTAPPFDSQHEGAQWALLARCGLGISHDTSLTDQLRPQLRRASVALVLAVLYRMQARVRPDDVLEEKARHYARVYEDEVAGVRLGEEEGGT